MPKGQTPKRGFNSPEVLAKAKATREANKASKLAASTPVSLPKPLITEAIRQDPPQSVLDVQTGPGLDPLTPIRDMLSGQMKGTEIFSPQGDPMNPIPGYRTYWAVDWDQGARLNLFRMSGWEHVHVNEVLLNEGQSSDDPAGNVRKWSKETGPNGQPIYMYLMKKSLKLQAEHDKQRDAIHDAIEARIKGGAKSTRPTDKQYAPGEIPGTVTSMGINIESKLYQPR